MDTNKKDAIKKAVAILILVILIGIVGFILIKYDIEGEANPPFLLNKVMVISTADGIKKDETEMTVNQNNDLYLDIEKNDEYKEECIIKTVSIENIRVLSNPKKGIVVFYRPSNTEGDAYIHNEEFLIEDSIIYTGDSKTDLKTLSISNQGGMIGFRTCVKDAGSIAIDENATERAVGYINQGTLLQEAKISVADIKYNLGFDIVITLTDGKMFKGYANLSLPIKDVENSGVQGVEKVEMNDVIFKRIKVK